jgi:hypothetical protein
LLCLPPCKFSRFPSTVHETHREGWRYHQQNRCRYQSKDYSHHSVSLPAAIILPSVGIVGKLSLPSRYSTS